MHLKATAVLVPLALILSGCGGSGGPAQQGYFAQPDSNSAQFLQLTTNGSALSGNLQSASISSADPTMVSTFNAAFTGTVANGQLTLAFPQGLGFTSSVSGSYSGSDINLSVPQADGTLATEVFAPSNTDAYNSAVHALHQRADQALADQQAAAAAQQQAQLEAEQRAAVDKAIARVNGDFSAISSDINAYKSLYSSVNNDEQQAYRDTVTTYNDLKKVQAEGRNSPYCSGDAGVVGGDAGVVAGDLGVVGGDRGVEQADVRTVNNDISQLDVDFQKFEAARAAIPSYQPSAIPTSSQISQDHTAASQANSQADAMIAAALKQVQIWANLASQYATNAAAICG
jgi:hypothetical protein